MVPIVRAYQFIILQFGEGIFESMRLVANFRFECIVSKMRPTSVMVGWPRSGVVGSSISLGAPGLVYPRISLRYELRDFVNITLTTSH